VSKVVGVIGGMGPAATWDFCAKLTAATPAGRDQDHLRVLVDCEPGFPDRNAALAGKGPSPGPALADAARGLERSGAQVLVIACNTAHAWAEDIRRAAAAPLIDMVTETAAEVRRRWSDAERAGLLAVDGCRAAGLYQAALAAQGVAPVLLGDAAQARFMRVIYGVKAGITGPDARTEMSALAAELVAAGADVLISACTEVPLVLAAEDVGAPLIDSTDVLVARTVAFARA
jgi:aspartate racemase